MKKLIICCLAGWMLSGPGALLQAAAAPDAPAPAAAPDNLPDSLGPTEPPYQAQPTHERTAKEVLDDTRRHSSASPGPPPAPRYSPRDLAPGQLNPHQLPDPTRPGSRPSR